MPYHFNKRCHVIRETVTTDEYGGANVVTGTIVYYDQPVRIDMYIPRIGIQIQGNETRVTYTFIFHYNVKNPIRIYEQDILLMVFPPHDPIYNRRFRVEGVALEAVHPSDPRGIMEISAFEIKESRSADSI